MAWTAPDTFADGNVLMAAQMNSFVRDNMALTMPALATTSLPTVVQHFVASGTNSIVAREISTTFTDAVEPTTSTSYTDLATVGPVVTVTTGTAAIVMFEVFIKHVGFTGETSFASVAITGATSSAASDANALRMYAGTSEDELLRGAMVNRPTLTAGSNTFTLKYRVTAETTTFMQRRLTVIAL